jgi:hypothetical protein
MKKKINLIIVSLIVTVILGINISYAITANDASNSKSSFFSVNKEKLSQGDTLEMTIDLSQIDYDEFEFRLTSNIDMDEIYADDDSADNSNITVNSESDDSDLSLNINKQNLDLSQIVLYYQIPDSIKVGTKIKLNAQIVISEEDNVDNESANKNNDENNKENNDNGSTNNDLSNNGNDNVNNDKNNSNNRNNSDTNNNEDSKVNTNMTVNNENSSEKVVYEKQIQITIVKQDSNSNNANMGNGNLNNNTSNNNSNSGSENSNNENDKNQNNGVMQNPDGNTNNAGNMEQGTNSKNPNQDQATDQTMQGMSNMQDSMQTQTSNKSSAQASMNTLQSASSSETLKSASTQVETAIYNGSNNNYLSSLEIDGVELTADFNKEKTTYFATVEGLDSITVTAIAEDSDSKVSITGTDLKSGENKILISVTAENGNVRYYRIYVTNN